MVSVLRLLVLVLVWAFPSEARPAQEAQQRRASHLYHLTKFVEWPATAFADAATPLRICVLGGRVDASTRALDGRKTRGRTIEVREASPASKLDGCQVVLFGPAAPTGSLRRVDASGVLTVGQGLEFASAGGMVAFFETGDGVRVAVNPTLAKAAGLRVSSRLLTVADVIEGPEAPPP